MASTGGKTSEGTARRPSRLVLGEQLTLDGAEKLHKRLRNCAARGVDVNLNAAKVETVDTASLQLLAAFAGQINGNGNTLSWQSPSDALIASARLLGLAASLHLEDAAGQE